MDCFGHRTQSLVLYHKCPRNDRAASLDLGHKVCFDTTLLRGFILKSVAIQRKNFAI